MKQFDYFYGIESQQFSFIQIPLELFTNEYYKNISSDAKILYGLMLSRMSLSQKNNWFDDDNRVYIIYKIQEIQDTLCCGKNKAVNILKELENAKLIQRNRQGLGKADLIYVLNIFREITSNEDDNENQVEDVVEDDNENQAEDIAKVDNENQVTIDKGEDCDFFGFENQTSRGLKNKLQGFTNQTSRGLENKLQGFENQTSGVYKSNPNSYIYNNNIDFSYIYNNQSINNGFDRFDRLIEVIKHNIAYDDLIAAHKDENDKAKIDEIINIIADTVAFNNQPIKISGNNYPAEIVKSVFLKLAYEDIEYALLCLNKNAAKVKNIKNYIIAVLYNTKLTKNNYCKASTIESDKKDITIPKGTFNNYSQKIYTNEELEEIVRNKQKKQ